MLLLNDSQVSSVNKLTDKLNYIPHILSLFLHVWNNEDQGFFQMQIQQEEFWIQKSYRSGSEKYFHNKADLNHVWIYFIWQVFFFSY